MTRAVEFAAKALHRLGFASNERTLTVQTDLANFCNLRCRMCYFYAWRPEVRVRLDFDEFRRRFDSFAHRIRTFGVSCATEPLVVPEEELYQVFGWIRARGIPDSFMVTNAMLLRPRIAETFINAGLSRLIVSLDSHVKETYEGIRLGARFETVVENVRYFRDYRTSKRLTSPALHVNFVMMRRNIEEVGPYLDFVHELGADAVDFRHLVPYSGFGLGNESLVHHKELCNKHLHVARAKCTELGIRIANIPDDFSLGAGSVRPQGPTKRSCNVPSSFIYVRPDGGIQPCTLWFGEEAVGNLANDDFATVGSEQHYATFRDEVAHGVLVRRCCKSCPSLGGGGVDNESSFEEKSP